MKKTKYIAGTILLLVFLCSTVFAATYDCNSCNNCTEKIEAASSGDIVYLTEDITELSGSCIVPSSSINGVTFDCQGNSIEGKKGLYAFGIWFTSSSDNTIKNCRISLFFSGIYLSGSSNNNIISNTLDSLTNSGIGIFQSDSNTLINNTANNNSDDGIYLYYSDTNTLTSNTANYNDDDGIYLYSSNNNTLTSNTANNNSDNGIYLSSSNNILDSNHVCYNIDSDFYLSDTSVNSGDNNICDNPAGWNDTGTTGCTYACSGVTTTTTSTTTTVSGECSLKGDQPPCDGTVELAEVIDMVSLWVQEQVTLSDVIEAINNWAT